MIEKEIGSLYSIVALSILFSIFCLTIFYYIKNRFLFNAYNNKKWVKPICESIFGGILGTFSLFFFYYIQQFDSNVQYSLANFLLFSIICFPLIYYCSPYASGFFTIISIAVWSSYLNIFSHDSMYIVLFAIITFEAFGLGFNFFKNKILKITAPFLSTIFLLILTVSIPKYRDETILYVVLANVLLFSYLYIFIAKYINDFFSQTVKIKQNISYENKYFINSNYSKDYFYKFIKENKIIFGYFVMIDFNELSNTNISLVYEQLTKVFENQPKIFFKTTQGNFCFFIKKDSAIKDDKVINYQLSRVFNNLVDPKSKINFLITIYGINSNLFEELIVQCRSMISLQAEGKIIFFNNKNNLLDLKEKIEVKNLYSEINFNSINVDFVPLEKQNQLIVFSKISYPFEINEKNLIKKYENEYRLIERIISNIIAYRFRYSSWNSKALLVLPYPVDVLNSSNFRIEKFINTFINNFGKEMINKVIITLPEEADLSNKCLLKNLDKFKFYKIKLGSFAPNSNKAYSFDYYFK